MPNASVGLPSVTALWLWLVDPKLFISRTRRHDKRCVEHRLNVAMVAHKMHIVVAFG
jgi:hypothetical protein